MLLAAALVRGHQRGGAAQVPGRSAAPFPCHSSGFSPSLPGQCWLLSFSHHLPSKPTFFQQQSTTRAFPSTLIREGCSCAAKAPGPNLVNNPLPSLPCVVPPNPVITSAKLLWPRLPGGDPRPAVGTGIHVVGSLLSLPCLTCCTCLIHSILGTKHLSDCSAVGDLELQACICTQHHPR